MRSTHPLPKAAKRWVAHSALADITTEELLEEAKRRLGVQSDYALSKGLNVTPTTVSRYKNRTRAPSALMCIALASLLGLDAADVLRIAEQDRMKRHHVGQHQKKTRSLFDND
jgi:Helix-turn-helix